MFVLSGLSHHLTVSIKRVISPTVKYCIFGEFCQQRSRLCATLIVYDEITLNFLEELQRRRMKMPSSSWWNRQWHTIILTHQFFSAQKYGAKSRMLTSK